MKPTWLKTAGLVVAAFVAVHDSPRCSAQADAKKDKGAPRVVSLSLSMEVNALQTLHQFNFSKAQLENLQQLTVGTAQKDQKRIAGKASKEYRDKLLAVRKALLEAKDDDHVLKMNDELEALRDKEKPSLDDHVDITASARPRTAEALRLLRPRQLALYVAHSADDIVDPWTRLIETLEEARALSEEDWKEQRDDLAEEISRLAVGLDAAKAKPMTDQVVALMVQARKLTKAEYQQQQAELKKSARQIVGDISAFDVIRHQVEIDMATLLSNPRLPQALRARLK